MAGRVTLTCPGCGGVLELLPGGRRLLKPQVVFVACGRHWINLEAVTRWTLDSDEADSSLRASRHFTSHIAKMFFAKMFFGLMLIPILFAIWSG